MGSKDRDSKKDGWTRLEGGAVRLLHLLDLLDAPIPFTPVPHDDLCSLLEEELGHLVLLLGGGVAANVRDDRDASSNGTEATTLAVLNSNTLRCLLSDNLERVEIDGWVRLGSRLFERSSSGEDVVFREETGLVDLLDGGLDASKGRGRDDSHTVLLLSEHLDKDLVDANAGLGLSLEFSNDTVLLLLDVALELLWRNRDVKLALDRDHHAAEVLANELADKLVAGVALLNAMLLQDLVGNVGTGLKSKLLGKDEGVVTVKEDVGDLYIRFSCLSVYL